MINPEEQYKHKETGLWHDVIREFAVASDYKIALDIGTAAGLSAFTIAMAGIGEIISVGDKGQDGARQLARSYGYDNRITFNQVKSEDFWDENYRTYDFICIDGSHEYREVQIDAREGWKVLNKGGYIVFDDYAHPKYVRDVKKAVDEWAIENGVDVKFKNGKAYAQKV